MALKHWLRLAGVAGLVATALAVPGVEAASKTLYVGTCKGPSPYTTIQSAVDAVNDDGFTIYVCPGTYNESVQVHNKEDLTIRNYVVKNQPAPLIDAGGGTGFDVRDSKEVEIRGLRIANLYLGVYALNSPETEVRNTIITTSYVGIFFEAGSDKSEAQQNTISNSTYGIAFGNNTSVTVKQNTISSGTYGIYGYIATKSKVESNSVTNAYVAGMYFNSMTRASVRKNTTSFGQYGIYITNSTTSTINENTAKNHTQAGVSIESNTTGNTLKKNLLQGNGTDAVDNSTGSKTAGTANTWSDNKCDTSLPGDLCGSAATQRRAPPSPPTPPSFP